jgi:ketosteroid isomerase-like protein
VIRYPTAGALRSIGKSATLVFLFDSQFGRGLTSGTPMRAQSDHRLSFQTTTRLVMLLVLFSCFVLPAYGGFPHHENLHKEIEQLEMDWRQASLNNDVPELDHLLADDYLGISANGTLETKGDVLAARRSGATKMTQLDLGNFKIRIYGDTAVVNSKADVIGKNGDRDISGRYRYTRVYKYRDGQWKIVSFEASRIPDTSERADKH